MLSFFFKQDDSFIFKFPNLIEVFSTKFIFFVLIDEAYQFQLSFLALNLSTNQSFTNEPFHFD
jgi:hypothetical protein